MIRLDELTVTQNALRNPGQVARMVEFVRGGGVFDARGREGGSPVFISRLTDGRLYLHDGHHRCVAIHLAGRNHLRRGEYEVGDYERIDYSFPALSKGWHTPFDLDAEVRLADFGPYRDDVRALIDAGKSAGFLYDYIWRNKHRYAEPRRLSTVAELAQGYLNEHAR